MSDKKEADRPGASSGKKKGKRVKRKQGNRALVLGAVIGGGVFLFVVLGGLGVFAVLRYRSPPVTSKAPDTENKSPAVLQKPADKDKPAVTKTATKTHEEIYLAAIESMRKVEAAFLQANDAASADKAAAMVRTETLKLQDLQQQIVALGRASAAEKERVNRHGPTITAVSKAMGNAISQIPTKVQGGQMPRDNAQRLLAKGEEFGRAQVDFGRKSAPLLD